MRTAVILIFLFLSITSCNDSNKEKKVEIDSEKSEMVDTTNNTPVTSSQENTSEQIDSGNTNTDRSSEITEKDKSVNISGLYINKDHLDDNACKCYCVDISLTGTSELCLMENELYINARFQKNGNEIAVYYSGKSASTTNEEIPWDEFETNTPIAILSPLKDGNLELDWKGFSINGEIALDYALYGKKTLEGTYKKK